MSTNTEICLYVLSLKLRVVIRSFVVLHPLNDDPSSLARS